MAGIYTLVFMLMQFISITSEMPVSNTTDHITAGFEASCTQALYKKINDPSLNPDALTQALKGYNLLRFKNVTANNSILTIIDYSKSSDAQRFFVIDVSKGSILFKSLVAHGKNSGTKYADSFSNKKCSYKSSIGFFLTGDTYYGKHGLSLRLTGLEKDINDNAMDRAIVIHSASYVNEEFIKNHGRLGRSYGCPALPQENYENIINTIRDKICLFIYYPDKDYLLESKIINPPDNI
jgi:hypothetical protein